MAAVMWKKSSRSGSNGANCVEVASLSGAVGIRDSKNPAGGHLAVSGPAFSALLDEIRKGRHGL